MSIRKRQLRSITKAELLVELEAIGMDDYVFVETDNTRMSVDKACIERIDVNRTHALVLWVDPSFQLYEKT